MNNIQKFNDSMKEVFHSESIFDAMEKYRELLDSNESFVGSKDNKSKNSNQFTLRNGRVNYLINHKE